MPSFIVEEFEVGVRTGTIRPAKVFQSGAGKVKLLIYDYPDYEVQIHVHKTGDMVTMAHIKDRKNRYVTMLDNYVAMMLDYYVRDNWGMHYEEIDVDVDLSKTWFGKLK